MRNHPQHAIYTDTDGAQWRFVYDEEMKEGKIRQAGHEAGVEGAGANDALRRFYVVMGWIPAGLCVRAGLRCATCAPSANAGDPRFELKYQVIQSMAFFAGNHTVAYNSKDVRR